MFSCTVIRVRPATYWYGVSHKRSDAMLLNQPSKCRYHGLPFHSVPLPTLLAVPEFENFSYSVLEKSLTIRRIDGRSTSKHSSDAGSTTISLSAAYLFAVYQTCILTIKHLTIIFTCRLPVYKTSTSQWSHYSRQ